MITTRFWPGPFGKSLRKLERDRSSTHANWQSLVTKVQEHIQEVLIDGRNHLASNDCAMSVMCKKSFGAALKAMNGFLDVIQQSNVNEETHPCRDKYNPRAHHPIIYLFSTSLLYICVTAPPPTHTHTPPFVEGSQWSEGVVFQVTNRL